MLVSSESVVKLFPQTQLVVGRLGDPRHFFHFLHALVVRICEVGLFSQFDLHPNGDRFFAHVSLQTLILAVEEEGAVFAGVDVVREEAQQICVELELTRHLVPNLMHAVQELQKDRRSVRQVARAVVPVPTTELMPERKPIFVDQNLKAFEGAIVGIQQQLSQRTKLRRTVPAIGAMHKDIRIGVTGHDLENVIRAIEQVLNNLSIASRVESVRPELQLGVFILAHLGVRNLTYAFVGVSNTVDVFNFAELELAVCVTLSRSTIFEATAFQVVHDCVEVWSCVKNHNCAS